MNVSKSLKLKTGIWHTTRQTFISCYSCLIKPLDHYLAPDFCLTSCWGQNGREHSVWSVLVKHNVLTGEMSISTADKFFIGENTSTRRSGEAASRHLQRRFQNSSEWGLLLRCGGGVWFGGSSKTEGGFQLFSLWVTFPPPLLLCCWLAEVLVQVHPLLEGQHHQEL